MPATAKQPGHPVNISEKPADRDFSPLAEGDQFIQGTVCDQGKALPQPIIHNGPHPDSI